ncbi:MAG TPA: ABC transporter ATP-binding protein [Calditrichia bacterium]|nr:ABC transporter ATP-binding protein [Calditrichia bacterium]HQV31584.1 ABC transporter ATP-binding protein [Calditrichia bacterium]
MNIIKTEQLKKTYSDNGVPVEALRGINLEIGKGEFTVIAGPSGSGKTTLLNLIGALDHPSGGKVFIEGVDIGKLNRNQLGDLRLNKIGFVFQAYNLIPVLSALENVEFTMMLMGLGEKERRERSLEIMADLGIGDLAYKRPNEMSGGQQQRLAVARAIVTRPALVLADEPTANLDSHTGAELLKLMEDLNREKNITFVFSSHDQQVMDHAKRLLILKDGLIVEDRPRS